jgi:hypothetical protein
MSFLILAAKDVDARVKPGHDESEVLPPNSTMRISMSDLTRRVNGLQKWFERCGHALAFDSVFASALAWPGHGSGGCHRNLEQEDCVSVIALPRPQT